MGLEDEESLEWDAEPLPSVEEDDFLIPQRLRAWGELLRAMKGPGGSLLLTDNRIAVDHVLERAMEQAPDEGETPAVLLQISVPRMVPNDLEETRRFREAIARHLPWDLFCEKVEALAGEAREALLDEGSRKDLLARGRALASYFQESVAERLMERIAVLEPSWGEGWLQSTLMMVLIPKWSEVDLMFGARGEHPGSRNGVILHMEKGEGSAPLPIPGQEHS
jgi:hypothetical protein